MKSATALLSWILLFNLFVASAGAGIESEKPTADPEVGGAPAVRSTCQRRIASAMFSLATLSTAMWGGHNVVTRGPVWIEQYNLKTVVQAEDEVAFPAALAALREQTADPRDLISALRTAFTTNDHTTIAEALLDSLDARTNGEVRSLLTDELVKRTREYAQVENPLPWIEMLLERGADANPALVVAATEGHLDLVRDLLKAGARASLPALEGAAKNNQIPVLDYFKQLGSYSHSDVWRLRRIVNRDSGLSYIERERMTAYLEAWLRMLPAKP